MYPRTISLWPIYIKIQLSSNWHEQPLARYTQVLAKVIANSHPAAAERMWAQTLQSRVCPSALYNRYGLMFSLYVSLLVGIIKVDTIFISMC